MIDKSPDAWMTLKASQNLLLTTQATFRAGLPYNASATRAPVNFTAASKLMTVIEFCCKVTQIWLDKEASAAADMDEMMK